MVLYIGIIIILILGSFVFRRKGYFIFSVLLLTFFAGLRHPSMGLGDVENVYYSEYINSKTMSFGDILFSFNSHTSYFLLMKIFTSVDIPFQFFLICNSAFFVVAAEKMMYRYSKDYLLSQIIFVSSAYIFSFALIRQYMAMGFLLLAFPYLLERKPVKYCIFVFLGALCHYSVLVAVVLYPLVRFFKNDKIVVIMILIGFVIATVFPLIVLDFVKVLFPQFYKYYEFGIYSQGNKVSWVWMTILMMPILIYFVLNILRNAGKTYAIRETTAIEKDLLLVNGVGVLVFCFSSIIVEFYRVSQYFTIIYMILLANLVCMVRNKEFGLFARAIIICCFIVYMFTATLQNLSCATYRFFWI